MLLAETSAFGPRPSTIEKQPTEVGPRTPAQATPSATQVTPSMERRNRDKQASLEKKKTRLVKQIDQVKMATAEGGKAQQIMTRQITQRIQEIVAQERRYDGDESIFSAEIVT